mmetsp:Transcript_41979/g.64277  ORF Transcript_41979/g.64277 Transcript_41979/m.64277 type:complete len:103 (-) Transcript_41979:693-1001(-)
MLLTKRHRPDCFNCGEKTRPEDYETGPFGDNSDDEEFSYIKQFYLGQKINEVIEGDLKRPMPNTDYHMVYSRRRQFNFEKRLSMPLWVGDLQVKKGYPPQID